MKTSEGQNFILHLFPSFLFDPDSRQQALMALWESDLPLDSREYLALLENACKVRRTNLLQCAEGHVTGFFELFQRWVFCYFEFI